MKNMKINPMQKCPCVQQHMTNLKSMFPKVLVPDQYDDFTVFHNNSVRSLNPEAFKLEAIIHYHC